MFLHRQLLNTKGRAWLGAGLFALLILAFAPFGRAVVEWLRSSHLLWLTVTVLFFLVLAYILFYFVRQLKIRPLGYLAMAVLMGLVVLVSLRQRTIEERVHLLEFAVLALFFYKACSLTVGSKILLFGLPILLAMAVGWLDECWQALLPTRVFDLQDLFDNTIGGLAGTGLAYIRYTFGGRS